MNHCSDIFLGIAVDLKVLYLHLNVPMYSDIIVSHDAFRIMWPYSRVGGGILLFGHAVGTCIQVESLQVDRASGLGHHYRAVVAEALYGGP